MGISKIKEKICQFWNFLKEEGKKMIEKVKHFFCIFLKIIEKVFNCIFNFLKGGVTNMLKWTNRNFTKIMIFAIIGTVLWYSKSVLSTVFDIYQSSDNVEQNKSLNCGIEENEIQQNDTFTDDLKEDKKQLEQKNVETTLARNAKKNHKIDFTKKIDKKTNFYSILFILFIVAATAIVIILSVLLIKNDRVIQYEKLDRLRELKDEILRIGDDPSKESIQKAGIKKYCDTLVEI